MTKPNRHPRRALATLLLIAFATPAGADDAGPAIADTTVASASEPAPAADVAATPASVDEPAPRYPRAVIARPLTLPARIGMLGADAIGNRDLSAMSGAPIAGYGITDQLEVQAAYAFATRELEAKGSLGIDVGHAVLRGALGGRLEAIARVRGGYSLLDSAATPLMIGLHVQYNVTSRLAIISGVPGTQQLRIALADDAAMARPIDVGLPIGVGVQATNELYLQLDTKLAQLGISDSPTALILRDTTPVALTVVYNVLDVLDVQAAIGTDLSHSPGDALSLLLGLRFYAGQL